MIFRFNTNALYDKLHLVITYDLFYIFYWIWFVKILLRNFAFTIVTSILGYSSFFFLINIFIEVQLIYNANYYHTAKWFSFTYIYIYTCFFNILFSIMVYHRILNTFLYVIQQGHYIYKSLHLLTPTSHSIPSPTSSPLATTRLFSRFMILFLFHR